MNKIWVFVFITFLLAGCASLLQTTKLHETIRKPKNYCQLEEAEKPEITLQDTAEYDDSKCNPNITNYSIDILYPVSNSQKKYYGRLYRPGETSNAIFILPYSIKLKIRNTNPNTTYFPIFKLDTPKDTTCISNISFEEVPQGFSKLWFYNGQSLERFGGKVIETVTIIKKRKLTTQERQILLKEQRNQIEEEYQKDKQKNNIEYEQCNADHKKIVDFWQSNNSIKKFCNSIEYTWFSHNCKATADDDEKCKTLKDLFIDCYYQGAINADKTYVIMTFFNGLERGKIQFR